VAANIPEIPYTEIQERLLDIARISADAKIKARGVIQDVYSREIAAKFDWNFLFVSSGLTTIAEHKIGTVSINTGDTSLTFSSDAALTAAMTERKIKISGNDTVFDFTFTDSTGGTVNPSFEGNANASGASYTIFQPIYSLAQDFDRFPKLGGIYRWQGGRKQILSEEPYQEYVSNYQPSPSTPEKVRIWGTDTAGAQRIEFRPGPNKSRNYGYDYIRQVAPLSETSDGLVTIDAGSTGVIGGTPCRFANATTNDFLRITDLGDRGDSMWYPVLNIAHDSSLTLGVAFANTAVSSANYVIAKAPELPPRLHPAVLFGSVRALTLDQTDESFIIYDQKMAEALSDAKRIHVSRVYDQQVHTIAEDFQYRR